MGYDEKSLNDYSVFCKSVVAEYIESSTRFGIRNLSVLESVPTMRQFRITNRHELEVVSDAQDYHGVHQPSQSDFGSSDWEWYSDQVTKQAQSELRNQNTLVDLINSVKKSAYASISTQTLIRTHPRRLFHTYACSGCHGGGTVGCNNCSGSGQLTCNSCSGSGRRRCSYCGGSGTVSQFRQVRDFNGYTRTETQFRSCTSCSGGKIRCSSCSGLGKITCHTCNGSGRVTCSSCSGHGYLTKVTSTHTYTNPRFIGNYPEGTPDYVHAALCKVSFSRVEMYGKVTFHEASSNIDEAIVDFVYGCEIPYCELALDINGHKSDWVLFGEKPQIFDAGNAIEKILKDDFTHLVSLSQSRARFTPWFYRSARKIILPFMESEINQKIIDADNLGKTSSAIVEHVSRAVSEIYINDSIKCLKNLIKYAVWWSRVSSTVVLAVLSIPFSIVAVALISHADRLPYNFSGEVLTHISSFVIGINWVMGLFTIPFTLLGWFIAKWISKRWLIKAGGKRMVLWSVSYGLSMGKWSAVSVIFTAFILAGLFFKQWPLWVDNEGKAYGLFSMYLAPQKISKVNKSENLFDINRSKNKSKSPSR